MLSDPKKKKIYDTYGEEGLKYVRLLWSVCLLKVRGRFGLVRGAHPHRLTPLSPSLSVHNNTTRNLLN